MPFYINSPCNTENPALSLPILVGPDSTRALQSSPFQNYENLKKITFLQTNKKFKEKIFKDKKIHIKKCNPLIFPILVERDLTRNLQFTPFQNPDGVP